MSGPIAEPESEISGMAWYGDTLIFLPQYPDRFEGPDAPGILFALNGEQIRAYLDGARSNPLVPAEIPVFGPDYSSQLQGFEGFEAIAFAGEQVFMTIESRNGDPMMSYLVTGQISPDLSAVQLASDALIAIPPQASLLNRGEEALVLAGDSLLTLFETNGPEVNPVPFAHRFDLQGAPVDTTPFPALEYRLTDATPADTEGRFWAINAHFPGDFLLPTGLDALAAQFGEGESHARMIAVERLLELQLTPSGIALTGTPPVQLQLVDDFNARNWEGLAILEGRGFLLATDRHPRTIFAFVPFPTSSDP